MKHYYNWNHKIVFAIRVPVLKVLLKPVLCNVHSLFERKNKCLYLFYSKSFYRITVL
jgi:hypothetical protein